MDQSAKATTFRRLHLEPQILVLPNAWDVASAKALAAIPGCRALATTSAAGARSLGWGGGEQAPVGEMLRVNEPKAAAVSLPRPCGPQHGYVHPLRTPRLPLGSGRLR